MDGRCRRIPTPGWNGYSIARWEGDTLVVQTAGFRDDLWLDMSGSPMSDAARMTERIRRPNYGNLEIELTVDDPKVYTRPWTVSLTQSLALDLELIDEFCLENEKSYERMISEPGQVGRVLPFRPAASHPGDHSGAVAERLPPRVDLVENRQVHVGQRRRLAQREVLAALEPAVAAADEDGRQRMPVVPVAVGHVRAVEEHRVVEQRAVAVRYRRPSS